jgi:hypothetical protein
MASAAMVNDRSLQGWETFVGMWLALPLVVLVPAAAILSLVGFVRGPQLLRMRLLAWWVVGAGGDSLALALAPKPGFNPYVGTPQPLAGLSDGLLALCLGLCVFFATWWYVQARRESRAA